MHAKICAVCSPLTILVFVNINFYHFNSKCFLMKLFLFQELLTVDPNNYNGLVFSGLCQAELHQKEEARAAYHDAIKQNKDQFLAYQGLVNLYTKHWVAKLKPDDTTDLIMAYERLIEIIGR